MTRKGLFEDEAQNQAGDRIGQILIANVLVGTGAMALGILHAAIPVLLLLLYCLGVLPFFLMATVRSNRSAMPGEDAPGCRSIAIGCIAFFIYGFLLLFGILLGYQTQVFLRVVINWLIA